MKKKHEIDYLLQRFTRLRSFVATPIESPGRRSFLKTLGRSAALVALALAGHPGALFARHHCGTICNQAADCFEEVILDCEGWSGEEYEECVRDNCALLGCCEAGEECAECSCGHDPQHELCDWECPCEV
jgi:hypothetical protein